MRSIRPRFAVLALAILGLAACSKGGGAVTTEDMSMGEAKAPVTVIEYASASCSHCAAFNNEVFPAFKAKYIDTGKVHYVFREFLTPPQEVAAAGFSTTSCPETPTTETTTTASTAPPASPLYSPEGPSRQQRGSFTSSPRRKRRKGLL